MSATSNMDFQREYITKYLREERKEEEPQLQRCNRSSIKKAFRKLDLTEIEQIIRFLQKGSLCVLGSSYESG